MFDQWLTLLLQTCLISSFRGLWTMSAFFGVIGTTVGPTYRQARRDATILGRTQCVLDTRSELSRNLINLLKFTSKLEMIAQPDRKLGLSVTRYSY